MNRVPNMPFPVFILIAGCLLIILAPISTSAQPLIGAIGFEGINSVEGLPFQAKQVMTIVATENDGSKRTQLMKSHVFCDTKGRVRVERFYDGTGDPLQSVPRQIIINDNCGYRELTDCQNLQAHPGEWHSTMRDNLGVGEQSHT